MKRVTGLGGVFFKTNDKAATVEWYRKHLGIDSASWGGFQFMWREKDAQERVGYTVWSPFKGDTEYFAPSEKPFMINYRVADLAGLIAALKSEGVQVLGEIKEEENGKFAWIMDPDGNKLELWEPVDPAKDPYL
jgi:predicted enzyme related to lactoylglutathione lyase